MTRELTNDKAFTMGFFDGLRDTWGEEYYYLKQRGNYMHADEEKFDQAYQEGNKFGEKLRTLLEEKGTSVFNEFTCNWCKGKSGGYHSCPYAEDVKGDDDPEYCNCCDECKLECARDI